jgi:hypothetical protein
MKVLIPFSLIILSFFYSNVAEDDFSKYRSTYNKPVLDTMIDDTVQVTLNIFYDQSSPYLNFEGDSTKRNIFKVKYLDSDLEIYHIIDYKTDFWELHDSNNMVITDTIEFYKYPFKR